MVAPCLRASVVSLAVVALAGCGGVPKDAPGSVEACAARYERAQAESFFVLPEGTRRERLAEGWSKARAFVLAYARAERRAHRAPRETPRLETYRTQDEMLAASGRKAEPGMVLAGFTDRPRRRCGFLGYDEDVLLHEAAHWYLLTDDCEQCETAVRWAREHPAAVEDGLRGMLNR